MIDDNFFQFLKKHDTVKTEKQKRKNDYLGIRKNKLVDSLVQKGFAIAEKRRKPVETVCKTLYFESASKASFSLGYFASSPVKDAIRHKTKCGGYYWQYVKNNGERNND
jgi:hypothetical protein